MSEPTPKPKCVQRLNVHGYAMPEWFECSASGFANHDLRSSGLCSVESRRPYCLHHAYLPEQPVAEVVKGVTISRALAENMLDHWVRRESTCPVCIPMREELLAAVAKADASEPKEKR